MRRLGKEKLADYVGRVIKQKQLKLRDVERRAGGKITATVAGTTPRQIQLALKLLF